MPSLLSWMMSSFFRRFICHVTPCDVIARWQDSSLWDACFPSSMVLIMLRVVSCRSSEISCICFCENFLDSKNLLYLPSRKNEIIPADASELDAGVGFDEIVNCNACSIVEHGCGAFRNVSLQGECCEKCAPRSCG
jgi:hypothetical protein